MQWQFLGGVFRHDNSHIRNTCVPDRAQSIITAGKLPLPMTHYIEAPVRFFPNGRKENVVDEPSSHPT